MRRTTNKPTKHMICLNKRCNPKTMPEPVSAQPGLVLMLIRRSRTSTGPAGQQSCHRLFPPRNPTNLWLSSETRRMESGRCTGSIDCILHQAATGFDNVRAEQQQRTWGEVVGPPVTRGVAWQLMVGCCSGRWQLACLQLAPPTANRTK